MFGPLDGAGHHRECPELASPIRLRHDSLANQLILQGLAGAQLAHVVQQVPLSDCCALVPLQVRNSPGLYCMPCGHEI